MTTGCPLGLCGIESLLCRSSPWLEKGGLGSRSVKPPPNLLSGELGNAGLMSTQVESTDYLWSTLG